MKMGTVTGLEMGPRTVSGGKHHFKENDRVKNGKETVALRRRLPFHARW